jgi:malate dehydrogenase (oxaloacetate-decarboxylating)
MDYGKESLQLHKQNHGKVEITSKVPLQNKQDLAVAYTPGVGQVAQAIAANAALAKIYTIKQNTIAIVTDGSSVLGLGNLGPLAALPIMEGKAILFKQFAGVDAFPICLDTQDTEAIIQTVKFLAPTFGGINLEDISAPRCFEIEQRLQQELSIPVLHDDQQGTAVVVLAGLINALKLLGRGKTEVKIVINGAGAAGIAITKLLLEYGFNHITVCDSHGAILSGRLGLNSSKAEIAAVTNHEKESGSLAEVLPGTDVFIGVSKAGLLTADMIKTMNPEPIIFALANPVPEIMPAEAKASGAAIVATGRSDFPNQLNNVLAFPGIFRGALDHNVKQITSRMLLRAAENLAACVTNLAADFIISDPFDPKVAQQVAAAIRD